MPQMPGSIETLIAALDLERIEVNLFRGQSLDLGWQRVYGGQVIGQALVAASRTVAADRPVHSLHGYFMRPGDPQHPIVYEVIRDRDGGSFSTRRVVAIQTGEPIFSMSCSFHKDEDGFDHQAEMPKVPPPELLSNGRELADRAGADAPAAVRRYFARERPIELKPCVPEHFLAPERDGGGRLDLWFRAAQRFDGDPVLHRCVLAYASDMTLIDTVLGRHKTNMFDPKLMLASLDHAIWFHRPFQADDWLLYAQASPSAAKGRGLTFGHIFNRAGDLVASVAQEGLIRRRRDVA
jgi:acyl-CoA thioesterase II